MKSLKLYLLIGSILLVLYIITLANRPKLVDWTESYSDIEKKPFDTYILYNRLNDIFQNSAISIYRKPIYSVIAEDSIKNSTYIIVCKNFEISKTDYDQLTQYLKKGNDVFIASTYFGTQFEKLLSVKTEYYLQFGADSANVKYLNKWLDTEKYFGFNKGAGSNYFAKFDTSRASVISENFNHKANFLKFSFGKGSLYLVSNPKIFSNYGLLSKDGAQYAAISLSYLKKTDKLIWDEYYSRGDGAEESPMRVFLSRPGLKWAYYITIFSLLLFVLFEIKRRQRIIPVNDPLENKTLEFVSVVGQVYYEKRDNANIAGKKVVFFLEYLRDEYQLKTNKLDNEFIEKLSSKLNLDNDFINELITYIDFISNTNIVTDRELINLNKLIEQFYIKSR